jgi:hypothetical protein
VAFNLQPRPNGQLLLGSSRQYGETSREVDDRLLRRMVRRALDFVPELAEVGVIRAWTGFRAATDDHLPLVGPLPGRPRILLAAGHEGHGVTTSLGTARILADTLLGRKPPIPTDPYRPDRLAEARPDLVFVALSFPKGERLIARLRQQLGEVLPATWWIGVGAAFDFVSGAFTRAPRWMQHTGTEWIFRMLEDPKRLVQRYLVHDLPYAGLLFAGALRRRLVGP